MTSALKQGRPKAMKSMSSILDYSSGKAMVASTTGASLGITRVGKANSKAM